MANKKKNLNRREQRRLRTQQIIFAVIAGVLILSWVITLIAR